MPWIENVAADDIPTRFHHEAGENSMLISIVDPASWRPTPAHKFKEQHNFEFLDIEKNDFALDEAMRCSQEQANELVRLLQHALANRMNVVVHCYAGVQRSATVVLCYLLKYKNMNLNMGKAIMKQNRSIVFFPYPTFDTFINNYAIIQAK